MVELELSIMHWGVDIAQHVSFLLASSFHPESRDGRR